MHFPPSSEAVASFLIAQTERGCVEESVLRVSAPLSLLLLPFTSPTRCPTNEESQLSV